MPQIKVVFWNLENFGTMPPYKTDYGPLCGFVAWATLALQADLLFIQELKAGAIVNQLLQRIHQELCTLGAPPMNNWYYDWIKGSVRLDSDPAPPVAPYATSQDLDWDDAHYEGYALFWNQNVAKFRLTAAPPLPGGVANTQSETARTRAQVAFGFGPGAALVTVYGMAVPAGGLLTPGGANAYTLPAGTTAPPGAPIPGVALAGGAVAAATPVNAGLVLPQGTTIGPLGVTLSAPINGRNEVVIPGNYVLTEPCTLPAAGTHLVPEHPLALVLQGRDTSGGLPGGPSRLTGNVAATNYTGVGYAMTDLFFTRGAAQPASRRGSRRPAYVTLDVNRAGGLAAAQRLVPVVGYHAPSAAPASSSGMQRAAYSQPLYQAYDWGPLGGPGAAPPVGWIDNARALLGGDFNVATDAVAYAYQAFQNVFAAGGANCQVRVYNPAPGPPPLGRADNVLNKTMVQIAGPFGGAPIMAAARAAYRAQAIDNVFYRGFTLPQAPLPAPAEVFDLLAAVSLALPGFNAFPAVIQRFLALQIIAQNLAVAVGGMGPAPHLPQVQNPAAFAVNVALGAFVFGPLPARNAAEFVNLCVSDHLPVMFEMQL